MSSTTTTTQTSLAPTAATTLSGVQGSTSSSNDQHVPRGPVRTKLNFFRDPEDGSPPHNYVEKPPEGRPQRNFGEDVVEVEVNDVRGREEDFSLDKDAFQAVKGVAASGETEFVDDDHIKRVYYPEVERLLLDVVPGAHKVTIFDHTVRRSNPDAPRAPVTRVHVDQTERSTRWRVKLHDPDRADELLGEGQRYRIINVWRPINGTVVAHPLGFASADTVDDSDLVPVEHRYPHRTGETAAVRHNPDQKFYYWSGMDNDERLLLKCFDSRGGVGQRVPHTAFVDPRTPQGAKGRESIEVRALVYG
ncbi:uncharacterized protein PV06_02626 [Exophiala oligosperma]|uniref:Methyltransferase n=2 Tax=Chaetothyriales TaxID=34395 RepID=A0A0D2CB09_9EURO|nr:uncharacterized protein PV06_02626 [Exophiala oligosperma]KAJ9633029.1 hypothetical protein H2204_007419 [Knufia peltigerae]KIW47012.1 hypothetical protein PV06_02626 [Exophiala oligosperma]